MPTSISIVLQAYNEAGLLDACLTSVSWADEVLVVDMQSQDDSMEIARKHGASVYTHPWAPIAEFAHNYALSKATKDWVLLLAPDERVTPALADQIRHTIESPSDCVAFLVPRRNYIFGRWIRYSGWRGDYETGLIRLFRRGRVSWRPEVHAQPIVDGPIGTIHFDEALDNAISHINYTSVEQFVEKLNRYTTGEAEKRLCEGRTFRWSKLFYHPLVEFWRRYVAGQGYRDGMHGLVLSVLMAFYADVILIKMWESSLRKAEP